MQFDRLNIQDVLERLDDIVLLITPDGRVTDANQAARERYGYTADELRQLTVRDLEAVESDAEMRATTARAATRGAVFETRHRRADGSELDVEVHATPLELDGEKIIVTIINDVTQRKAAQVALSASEFKFRTFVDYTVDWEFWTLPDGSVAYVSPSCERISGYSADEFMSDPQLLTQIAHPDDRAQAENHLHHLDDGPPSSVTFRIITKSGETRWIEHACQSIFGQDGEWLGRRGSNRDITERVEAEERILHLERQSSEARYRRLFETVPAGFAFCEVVSDEAGVPQDLRVVEANSQLAAMVAMDDISGRLATEVLADLMMSATDVLARALHVIASGQPDELELDINNHWLGVKFSAVDATHVVVTVEDVTQRKRAEVSLERTSRALRALGRANEALLRATDESTLLAQVCEAVADEAGYVLSWVGYALDDANKTVSCVAAQGPAIAYVDGLDVRWDESPYAAGPTGRSIKTAQPVIIHDVSTDESFAPWRAKALAAGIQSSAAFPLSDSSGKVFGTLMIYSADAASFHAEETILLERMASNLAYGIEALRTREQSRAAKQDLVASNKRLAGLLKTLVETMSKVVEARDPYTQGHEKGVARIARRIATEMGLPPREVEGIEIAALMHDVGKLAVPAETLTKPGKLNDIEIQIIQRHAEAGYDILKGIDFQWPIAEIVLQHHERMDGSGYPRGLTGDEILLAARILMVADTVEAMSGHRPYRPSLGIDAAVAEVVDHPERYDVDVVAACVRLYEQGALIPAS